MLHDCSGASADDGYSQDHCTQFLQYGKRCQWSNDIRLQRCAHFIDFSFRQIHWAACVNRSGASADENMEEEDEEGAPAIRLGDADREASQSAGDSLAPSNSGQYDSNEGELMH